MVDSLIGGWMDELMDGGINKWIDGVIKQI